MVGQNQIHATGTGLETRNVPEEDWITLSPGDVLGVWVNGFGVYPLGEVNFTSCR